MNYYGNNDYRDYLAHHGILGMKWGKRNGPPYPLGASDHSASERKAGWRKSLSGGGGGGGTPSKKKTSKKAKASTARSRRNERLAAATEEVYRKTREIEAPYKRFQNLSEKDTKREGKAEEEYLRKVAGIDSRYKKERASEKQAKKISRIERGVSKDLAYAQRDREGTMALRNKYRKFVEGSFDKNISKLKKRYDSEKYSTAKKQIKAKMDYLEKSKRNTLKDFDSGTVAINRGFDRYSKVIKNKGKASIKAVKDKSYKNTQAYIESLDAYKKQAWYDALYGQNMTVFKYSSDEARRMLYKK